jgi:hypothetical protein
VQIALVPFGERALRHFIYLERPEGMDLADAEGFAAVGRAQPLTNGDELMAVPEDYQTVGHLYRGIEHGPERLVQRHGEDGVFIGPPKAQATIEVFERPELTAVTDLASAKAAIELIVEQGEGARGDWRDAHFGKFIALLQDYRAARAADPAFEPARPVELAYVRRPPDVEAEVATIGDPSAPGSPTCYVLPHRQAAWQILAERLEELADRTPTAEPDHRPHDPTPSRRFLNNR